MEPKFVFVKINSLGEEEKSEPIILPDLIKIVFHPSPDETHPFFHLDHVFFHIVHNYNTDRYHDISKNPVNYYA
jgi:hypothetical protein